MARQLKGFSADMGFVRAVVAAPSQAAALKAWGARDNLFARGAAREVHDPDLVKEATASPGEVLRRPIAETAAIVGAAKGTGSKRPAKSSVVEKAKAPTPPPSRDALDGAEAQLQAEEKAGRAALAAVEADQAKLDARREQMISETAAAVKKAKRKRDHAKASYEQALRSWDGA